MVGLLIAEQAFNLSGALGDVLTGVYVTLIVVTLVTYAYDWRARRAR